MIPGCRAALRSSRVSALAEPRAGWLGSFWPSSREVDHLEVLVPRYPHNGAISLSTALHPTWPCSVSGLAETRLHSCPGCRLCRGKNHR